MNTNQDSNDPTQTKAWAQLESHAEQLADTRLADLLADESRFSDFSSSLGELFFDFSRYRANAETLRLLRELASQRSLVEAVRALFAGATVNTSEGRAALHTSLRGEPLAEFKSQVEAERRRFLAFADGVSSGQLCGHDGKRFKKVINIGIGGSDLGPRMLVAALGDFAPADAPAVEFVAGIDGIELRDALAGADPATTLFIVCSKTFTTLETRSNADAARAWLLASLPASAIGTNFAAISANNAELEAFGLSLDNCFCIWDWVGGRYSLWSAIGLAAAIRLGSENFLALLAGAAAMDEHFLTAELEDNIPITMALLGVWNRNFLKLQHQVVLPYDQRLTKLPAYLQQLLMESQGKLVRQDGASVTYATGAALWGGVGSNAQHSYAQWLHQGSADAHVDFIATVNGPAVHSSGAHLQSLANLAAQSDALAYGQDADTVRAVLAAEGADPARIDFLVPQKVHPGNRSSLVVLMRELTPLNLGMLLAFYEHLTYAQSVIWGINPFDQWGVELGKLRARQFAAALMAEDDDSAPEQSPLVAQMLRWRDS